MGIIKRQFLKASAATYVGVVLGYLNVTILFPYFCTPEELGLYRVIINMATMFAVVAYMGTPQTIIKQLPLFKKKGQEKEFYGLLILMFLSTLVLSFSILYFLQDLFISFFSDKSPEVGKYYFYAVFIAFTLAVYVLFISNVRIIKRIAFPAFLQDVFLRILIMAGILLMGFSYIDFGEFVVILCSSYLFIAIAGIIYSLRLVPFSISFDLGRIGKSDIRETLNFSLLTFLASVSNIIIMNVDSLMITALAPDGLTDTGIYTIAFFIGSVLDIPKRMINLVTQPLISEYWVEGKIDKIEDAFKDSSVNGIVISSLIFAVIWLNLDTIYQIIPNSEIYIKGLSVVLFILIARLFEMACSIAPNIITQTRLYIYNLPLAFVLIILTISLNYLMIPKYGITGAAIATMLSVIAYNSLKLGLVYLMLGIQPFTFKSIRFLIFFIIVMYLQSLFFDKASGISGLLLENALVLIPLIAFLILDKTSPEIEKQLNKLTKRNK